MLQDIEIENFRCFEKTRISGFTRVNLIGGKNNSGKTALLEALLLEHST
ncbi:AAA family ATPase [Gloeothece verrucosa]|nr:AAA family ATPase [Gloeothece verrucosa]